MQRAVGFERAFGSIARICVDQNLMRPDDQHRGATGNLKTACFPWWNVNIHLPYYLFVRLSIFVVYFRPFGWPGNWKTLSTHHGPTQWRLPPGRHRQTPGCFWYAGSAYQGRGKGGSSCSIWPLMVDSWGSEGQDLRPKRWQNWNVYLCWRNTTRVDDWCLLILTGMLILVNWFSHLR